MANAEKNYSTLRSDKNGPQSVAFNVWKLAALLLMLLLLAQLLMRPSGSPVGSSVGATAAVTPAAAAPAVKPPADFLIMKVGDFRAEIEWNHNQ